MILVFNKINLLFPGRQRFLNNYRLTKNGPVRKTGPMKIGPGKFTLQFIFELTGNTIPGPAEINHTKR